MNSYQRRRNARMQRRFSIGDGVSYLGSNGHVTCGGAHPSLQVGVIFLDGTYKMVSELLLQSWPAGNKGKYGGLKNGGAPEDGHKYGKDKRRLHGGRTVGIPA